MAYKIMRFSLTEPKYQIRSGLTLYEAQAHCHKKDTHGQGWFDGYVKEGE